MKIYKYSGPLLLVLGLSLGSCEDSVLNLTPESTLTELNFYKKSKDINGAVLGIYNRYQSRKQRDWTVMEMPTDNIHRTGYFNIGGLDEINTMAFSSENQLFGNFWTETYNGIFRANAVLENIDTPTDYAAGQKEQYTGEARFMRALFYFDLVRMFGGVPKITSLLSVDESRATPRATEDEIYALVIEDLKAAIPLLPAKEGIATGRASKSAAVGLLGKVYVYRKDWTNAKTYLDMMLGYGYELQSDFSSLWKEATEDNKEIIFTMKYIGGTNGSTISTDFLPYFGVTGIAAAGNENVFPSWGMMKKFLPTDSRKAATFTEYWKSPKSPADAPENWYPYISKFAVPHTVNTSGLDIPVLRFADILLLRAETLFGLNQPDQALADLNKVRARAFKGTASNYVLADISTPEKFTDKLLLERQLEFVLENERWFDLVRTGRFMTVLAKVEWGYNPVTKEPQVVTLSPKPYYKYFPIPNNQIQLANKGVLTQNEGY